MFRRTVALRNLAVARASLAVSPRLSRFASSQAPGAGKICVVPFKVQPNEAKEYMYPASLMASGDTGGSIYALGLRVFGTGLQTIGKELGWGANVEVKSLAAAYWPVWRWDMMAEGPWAPAHGGEESPSWLTVREAYLPGNPFAPLSYLSFSIPPLPEDLKQYNPDRDLYQLKGTDIIPIDFTVNPFAALSKLTDHIKRSGPIGGMRVDPDKWSASILAAYPIYFPIYVADYVFKTSSGEERTFQIVMDAHDEDVSSCRVSVPIPPEARESGRMPNNYYINPAPFMPDMTLILGSAPTTPFQTPPSEIAAKEYSKWLSPEPTEDSIRPSPTLSVSRDVQINWDDVRIQAWNSAERDENDIYIDEAFEVQKNVAAIQNMAHASQELGDGSLKDINFTLKTYENGKSHSFSGNMSDMRKQLEESLAKATAQLDEVKPMWLKELDEKEGRSPKSVENEEPPAESEELVDNEESAPAGGPTSSRPVAPRRPPKGVRGAKNGRK